MHYYSVYGLTIASEFKLFGVRKIEAVERPDVHVAREALDHPGQSSYEEGRYSRATLHNAFLSWQRVGSIKIRDGREIHVNPLEDIPTQLVSLFITGAAMGVLLHQRGQLVLHASAVRIGDEAAAFIGLKGMGKSTTAAALVGLGHELVSDDVVAVDAEFYARPGSDVVKLWPTALEAALHDDPNSVPKIYPAIEKRAKLVNDSIVEAPVKLSAVYVLDGGANLSIDDVSPADAFVELVRNSYAPRFVGTDGTPPEHFSQCTRFAATIPLFRLHRKPDLQKLGDVARAVEEHFRQLPGTEK